VRPWLIAAVVYLCALAILAATGFFAVLLLVGPHGGLLPRQFTTLVFALFWLTVLIAPFAIARRVYKRYGEKKHDQN